MSSFFQIILVFFLVIKNGKMSINTIFGNNKNKKFPFSEPIRILQDRIRRDENVRASDVNRIFLMLKKDPKSEGFERVLESKYDETMKMAIDKLFRDRQRTTRRLGSTETSG